MSVNEITKYLKDIEKKLATGQAAEHTHRPVLENLLKAINTDVEVINDGKRIECGAPDLIILKGQIPIGYIETKDVGVSLDSIEADGRLKNPKTHNGEQFKRFLAGLPNLIYTDYLEYRWYCNGEKRMTVTIVKQDAKGKLKKDRDGIENWIGMMTQFFATRTITVGSPKELAQRMASLAQIIRDIIINAFASEDKGGKFHEELEAFRKVLIHNLEPVDFADMYAQTICYGLFAARENYNGKDNFNRKNAIFDIPETNPFLRRMFSRMAGSDLDERVKWVVDDLAQLLSYADFDAIKKDFRKATRQDDPVVHFYETFLAAYDPKLREMRGVYYTPKPVVSYIVRSIDHILKKDFGIKDGLADRTKIPIYKTETDKNGKKKQVKAGECHRVLILDPAIGTGTFLYSVIEHIHDHLIKKGMRGTWQQYVSKDLLPRLFGFELLMAPYAVAHLKLGMQLKDLGYKFQKKERLNIIMTNTLEEAFDLKGLALFERWIAEESNKAGYVKQEFPVMIVLGNPPYSYDSVNTGKWISKLISSYYSCNGVPLGEKNPKGLQDDYVKFIRFAQWRINQTGYGILGFITNNGYLDGPTYRGMRKSLIDDFDDIYVLDLHGNVKKREKCPDGSKDENVFDIQTGVSIGIMVKRAFEETKAKTSVYHSDLWGLREFYEKKKSGYRKLVSGKYFWLSENDIKNTNWNKTQPSDKFYVFSPRNEKISLEYANYAELKLCFKSIGVGVASARDSLTIHFDKKCAIDTVRQFAQLPIEEARERYKLGKDTRDWKISLAQADIHKCPIDSSFVKPILYRPFDIRYTYYTGKTCGFISMPRYNHLYHMLEENLALFVGRQGQAIGNEDWNLLFCGNTMEDYNLYRRGNNACIPLFLYPDTIKRDLFSKFADSDIVKDRWTNLSSLIINYMNTNLKMVFKTDGTADLKKTFGPEDIFNYIYAVFHSPTYRTRYAEFLKIDFPRLPLTSNKALFRELCKLGGELVGLHLMEQHGPDMTNFPIRDGSEVEKVRYTEPKKSQQGRVWINHKQYFDNVPPEVWEFHIGGYQVCHKWLKDRKGRKLEYEDVEHYCRIVSALSETIRLMSAIEKTIDKHGGWPLK